MPSSERDLIEKGEWCAVHGHEPVSANDFRVCGECWHAFRTEKELIDADLEMRRVALEDEDAEPARCGADIVICPVCTHGFINPVKCDTHPGEADAD